MMRGFVLLCLLALFGSTMAEKNNKQMNNNKQNNKQDKNGEQTASPVAAPSIQPNIVFSPPPMTTPPSNNPSAMPTATPTSQPSNSPIASPVVSQIEAPIKQPFMSPVFSPASPASTPMGPQPTAAPSGAPVVAPSDSPSGAPVAAPSDSPSGAPVAPPSDSPTRASTSTPSGFAVLTLVFLPRMDIRFTVVGEQVIEADLEAEINDFVKTTVISQTNILGKIRNVGVNVKVLPANERRRLRETQMDASVTGFIYFEGDTYPTTDRLVEVLNAFFANWGEGDLEKHLTTDDIQVKDLDVSFNGEFDNNEDTEPPDYQRIPQKESEPDNSPSTALVVGLSVGCVAFVAALALLFYQRRRHGKKESLAPTPMSSPSRSRQSKQSFEIDSHFFEGVDDVSLSGISMEGSMYTSNTPVNPIKPINSGYNSDLYDTTRLDKVISSALEFAAQHQGVNGAHVPSDEEVSSDSDHEIFESSNRDAMRMLF